MMRICEANSDLIYTVEMFYRKDENWTPDFASDVIDYEYYDHDKEAYIVESVQGVIDFIEEWNAYETEDDYQADDEVLEHEKNYWGERIGWVKCPPEIEEKAEADATSSAEDEKEEDVNE